MRHILLILGIAFYVTVFPPFVKNADAATCPRTNTGEVDLSQLTVDPNGMDYNCDYTPDGMKIKLFKILLCEQLPSLTNYKAVCNPIVSFSNGKEVVITADGTSPVVDGPVTLPEGMYTHAAIFIENRIGSKFTQTFSGPIQGNDGVGTTCWSNGNDAKISYEAFANGPGDYTKFSATCGTSSDANPSWSYYTYKGLWNPQNNGNNYYINSVPYLTYTGSGKDIHLLSDFSTLATVTAGDAGRNLDDENGIISNATLMMGATKLSPIANINPNTTGVDLGFKLKDTFFQKITTNNNYYGARRCSENHGDITTASSLTGSYACLSTSYATSFDFKFEVN